MAIKWNFSSTCKMVVILIIFSHDKSDYFGHGLYVYAHRASSCRWIKKYYVTKTKEKVLKYPHPFSQTMSSGISQFKILNIHLLYEL